MAVDQTQYSVAMDTDPSSGYPMPKVSADITQVDAIVPVDIQNRLTQTIQTHNAVSVPSSGTSDSSFFSCDGFDKLAITLKNDASVNSQIDIHWSFDGTTVFAYDTVLPSAAATQRAGITDVKAPYFRVHFINGDASLAHTISTYSYLKS